MLENFYAFADDGGNVIYLIAFVIFVIWVMVFERAFFLFKLSDRKKAIAAEIIRKTRGFKHPADSRMRRFDYIRSSEMARLSWNIHHPMRFIRSLVAICPLLGLLGTVTGMIELFDSISFFGTGSSRAILSAVSHTTIPTMAGMMAGLFGAAADIVLRHYAKSHLDEVKRLVAVTGRL